MAESGISRAATPFQKQTHLMDCSPQKELSSRAARGEDAVDFSSSGAKFGPRLAGTGHEGPFGHSS